MVDTLADWMLRYPPLFHGLEVTAQVTLYGFFAALWLNAFIMPGKKNEYAFPRRSKAQFWWRVAMLSFLALVPAYWREWHAHGTSFTHWDGVWAVVCFSSLVYANVLGIQNVKQGQRTPPPE